MAHVRHVAGGNGKDWECRWSWRDGQGKRKFSKQRFRTKAEANAKRREVEQAAADNLSPDPRPGKETFAVIADRWLRSREGTVKPSTWRKDKGILDDSVLQAFGALKVRAITTAHVVEFIQDLRLNRKVTAPTIRHHYLVLRAVLNYAAQVEKAIAVNPAIGVRLPTDRSLGRIKPEPCFLTESHVAALADHLDATPPYGLLVRFIAYTGLRVSEVSGLNIGDLDLLHSRLTVARTRTKVRRGWEVHTPKSGKSRKVPLPQWLRDDLVDYIETHPNATDAQAPLWPGRKITERTRHGSTSDLDWGSP